MPLRRFDGQWRCLVLRAYRLWDFPKGGVDPGESPLEAAVRELREETGLEHPAFDWGTGWAQTAPYLRGKVARYYLAHLAEGEPRLPVNPALGRPEHHEWRWVDLAQARRLLPPRLTPVLDWVEQTLARETDPARPAPAL